ncbi:MAG: polynucleotide adenylyltransferase PcnB [Porticoccus sp.]|nr:polynucleotide adenylyltransferase PcnB [Porticoccus sp.]MBQ0808055.1 polynucleotide adenylyltransferase PcnB [Porticoccus sp.]
MLKKLSKIFRKSTPVVSNEPHIIKDGQHPLSPKQISAGARKVVEQLSSDGYEAFLVGGCVRDLMLGLKPKDFDVATDATPEQVNQLFKRSRIIGRRFQIVHVRMGPEIIEVTTFRAHHTDKKSSGNDSRRSSKGLLLRDNIFGSINEDASRRDFTMNALYYHPQDNSIYDYADGLPDIEQRLIHIIGNPADRYREDPVRMLRAVRFAAKLGFQIEDNTEAAITKVHQLLADIPSARLFDEVLKLLMHGHALSTFRLLRQYQLFGILFPATEAALANDPGYYLTFVEQALTNTDIRIRGDKRVTPAFLFAALLWPALKEQEKVFSQGDASPIYALHQAAGEVTTRQCQRVAIPRRFTLPMREIWELQLRLPRRAGSQAFRLMENKRFRAGYDFLLLREDAGEIESGLGDWWTQFQDADEDKRQTMADSVQQPKSKRRRKRRKPPAKNPVHD